MPATEISRRTFLAAAAALPLAACTSALDGASSPLQPRRPPAPLDVPPDTNWDALPLVDFHSHVQRRVSPERLVTAMNASHVARVVLMPLYYRDGGGAINDGEGSDEQALAFARAYPGRFIPFLGMQRPELLYDGIWRWPMGTGSRLLAESERKLRSGEFFGMGEFMFRFYPYRTSLGNVAVSDMRYPPDSPLMHRFAELGAKYRVPLVMHCEAEPEFADQMIRLVRAHPDTTFVWAHNCGRSSAERIAAMFTELPNLYADLGLMMNTGGEGYGSYWPHRTPWMHVIAAYDGTLLPEMSRLFEQFPERFTIGTDTAHARVYEYYDYRASLWRRFLKQLSPPAARKIAFENAERLFRATPAGGV